MIKKRRGTGARLCSFFACIMMAPVLTCGCAHLYEASLAGPGFEEANALFSRASYEASLEKYERIIEKYPTTRDRALFEMGIIYAYPGNEQRDYRRSLECFQKILKDYPESRYRRDSAEMISHIDDLTARENKIIAQQTMIATLEQEIGSREREINALRRQIDALDRDAGNRESEAAALRAKIETLEAPFKNRVAAIADGSASRVLVEKRERRLTLLSNGQGPQGVQGCPGGQPGRSEREAGRQQNPGRETT